MANMLQSERDRAFLTPTICTSGMANMFLLEWLFSASTCHYKISVLSAVWSAPKF